LIGAVAMADKRTFDGIGFIYTNSLYTKCVRYSDCLEVDPLYEYGQLPGNLIPELIMLLLMLVDIAFALLLPYRQWGEFWV
jgi:hypothetical protein